MPHAAESETTRYSVGVAYHDVGGPFGANPSGLVGDVSSYSVGQQGQACCKFLLILPLLGCDADILSE